MNKNINKGLDFCQEIIDRDDIGCIFLILSMILILIGSIYGTFFVISIFIK